MVLCTTAIGEWTSLRADDGGLAAIQGLENVLVRVIRDVETSVVSIARLPRAEQGDQLSRVPGPLPAADNATSMATDFGSGVILGGPDGSDDRYVLTTAHVVFGRRNDTEFASEERLAQTRIMVRLASRHTVAAELVAADHRSDLAMLRLLLEDEGVPIANAPPIRLGEGSPLTKGRMVVALGNPYAIARDGSASASIGMVSNIARRPWPPRGVLSDPTEEDLTIHHYGTLLQVDTRLNLGSSGGALVDLEGRLVGLTTSMAALEGYEKSVGYAIPIDRAALRIIDSLRLGYEVEYGFLGIQPGEADGRVMAQHRELTDQAAAALVRRVAPHSPAEQGGLRPNDIVLSVDGVPVYSDIDLVREVGWLGPDFQATLSVLRPDVGRIFDLRCRLGKWPVYDESLSVTTRERHAPWRGLHADYSSARKRYLPANPLLAFPQGVVITRVDPGSPAAEAGLSEGEFIRRVAGSEVTGPAEFQAAVANRTGEVTLELSDGRAVTLKGDPAP